MFFYTYVIRSQINNSLYIGWTNNLKTRLESHNSKSVFATKDLAPFDLVYYEACLSKTMAIRREKQLKTGFGRAYLKRRLYN